MKRPGEQLALAPGRPARHRRVALGDQPQAHLAALEKLKQKLAAEGLFAADRKRPLPRIPKLIGLVTGNDAAAKRDVLTAITTRFPPAHVLVAETYVQGPRAAPAIVKAIAELVARDRLEQRLEVAAGAHGARGLEEAAQPRQGARVAGGRQRIGGR